MTIKYRNVNDVVREKLEDMNEGEEFKTKELAKKVDRNKRRVKTALNFFKKTGQVESIGTGVKHRWKVC